MSVCVFLRQLVLLARDVLPCVLHINSKLDKQLLALRFSVSKPDRTFFFFALLKGLVMKNAAQCC